MAHGVKKDQPALLSRALSDPTRLEICRLLADEELCVCHLEDELGLAQPLISHHIKVLREAGLVDARQNSYWTYYRLNPEALRDLEHEVTTLRKKARRARPARPCPVPAGVGTRGR